jgi:hypothetical protein
MALPGAVDKKATPLCLPPMAEIVLDFGGTGANGIQLRDTVIPLYISAYHV